MADLHQAKTALAALIEEIEADPGAPPAGASEFKR
jgi:hypothetical protein